MSGTYNGWSNIETWRLHLHLTNDAGEAAAMAHMAGYYADRFPAPNPPGGPYEGTFADWLRDYALGETGHDDDDGRPLHAFARDTVLAALERVDWQQLAERWMEPGVQNQKKSRVGT